MRYTGNRREMSLRWRCPRRVGHCLGPGALHPIRRIRQRLSLLRQCRLPDAFSKKEKRRLPTEFFLAPVVWSQASDGFNRPKERYHTSLSFFLSVKNIILHIYVRTKIERMTVFFASFLRTRISCVLMSRRLLMDEARNQRIIWVFRKA
jgi:hypothetical protein